MRALVSGMSCAAKKFNGHNLNVAAEAVAAAFSLADLQLESCSTHCTPFQLSMLMLSIAVLACSFQT